MPSVLLRFPIARMTGFSEVCLRELSPAVNQLEELDKDTLLNDLSGMTYKELKVQASNPQVRVPASELQFGILLLQV